MTFKCRAAQPLVQHTAVRRIDQIIRIKPRYGAQSPAQRGQTSRGRARRQTGSFIGIPEKLGENEIPDFNQTDVRGRRSGDGQQYCAPVAVSNSLVWLADKRVGQLRLIRKLASKAYMNTSLQNGTGTTGVINGVHRIALRMFGGYSRLEYQGWRKHPRKFSTGIKVPEFQWLTKNIKKDSAVWLNVGWYRFNKHLNEFRRIGGHWVTLVGYEDNALIIHDPAPRAGVKFANEIVSVSYIKGGTLVGDKAGLPTPAKGYMIFGKGMHTESNTAFAILDGAVAFSK